MHCFLKFCFGISFEKMILNYGIWKWVLFLFFSRSDFDIEDASFGIYLADWMNVGLNRFWLNRPWIPVLQSLTGTGRFWSPVTKSLADMRGLSEGVSLACLPIPCDLEVASLTMVLDSACCFKLFCHLELGPTLHVEVLYPCHVLENVHVVLEDSLVLSLLVLFLNLVGQYLVEVLFTLTL